MSTTYNLQLTTYNLQLTTYNLQLTTETCSYDAEYVKGYIVDSHKVYKVETEAISNLYRMNSILKSENRKSVTNELLQSEEWMRFQEAAGKRVVRFCGEGWSANGVVHQLPIVGEYLYVPRGPRGRIKNKESGIKEEENGDEFRISNFEFKNNTQLSISNDQVRTLRNGDQNNESGQLRETISVLIAKARDVNAGWIRIEPETRETLTEIRKAVSGRQIVKAPHDMQPHEVFRVDLTPSEEGLLAAMKPKTRYNIRVAEKRGVKVFASTEPKYRDAFIRLVTGTADRKGITAHPVAYYEAMLETLLGDTATLMIAEKDSVVIAANFLVFFGDTATYLHGGSDDSYRADMGPFLLQWEGMCEAKRRGYVQYDFGGVSSSEFAAGEGKWLGITRFKFGFSPATPATVFPGTYDVILSSARYMIYRIIQWIRTFLGK